MNKLTKKIIEDALKKAEDKYFNMIECPHSFGFVEFPDNNVKLCKLCGQGFKINEKS